MIEKLLELKHFEILKKKKKTACRIPIFSLSFCAKLDIIWPIYIYIYIYMHVNTSKHDRLRLYNIVLNEIKIQACKGFSCFQVSCKLTSKVEKSYENKHYQNSKVFKSIKEF